MFAIKTPDKCNSLQLGHLAMGAVGYLSVETAKPGRNAGCSARWKAPAPLDHGYRRWRILWESGRFVADCAIGRMVVTPKRMKVSDEKKREMIKKRLTMTEYDWFMQLIPMHSDVNHPASNALKAGSNGKDWFHSDVSALR